MCFTPKDYYTMHLSLRGKNESSKDDGLEEEKDDMESIGKRTCSLCSQVVTNKSEDFREA